MTFGGYDPGDSTTDQQVRRIADRMSELMVVCREPREVFTEFTRELTRVYDIGKGFLAVREGGMTRFLAMASWSRGRYHKNLSLKLPTTNSLFEKVAEHGQIYTENFAELRDGNLIERRLLLDKETRSFMLRPLKHHGRVIGLLGYSSDNPDAFVTFEEGLLDSVLDDFGDFLGSLQSA